MCLWHGPHIRTPPTASISRIFIFASGTGFESFGAYTASRHDASRLSVEHRATPITLAFNSKLHIFRTWKPTSHTIEPCVNIELFDDCDGITTQLTHIWPACKAFLFSTHRRRKRVKNEIKNRGTARAQAIGFCFSTFHFFFLLHLLRHLTFGTKIKSARLAAAW